MSAPTVVGGKIVPATRVSTVAGALEDSYNLQAFIAATTLQEVAARPVLRNRLAMIDPAAGWRAFKPLHEEAQTLRGKPEAGEGTNVHAAVEALANGRDLSGVDPALRLDAEATMSILRFHGLEIVATEEFGVVRGLREVCAGTRDAVVRGRTGQLYVLDYKTVSSLGMGKKFSGMKWACQLGLYSRAESYAHDFSRDSYGRPMVNLSKVSPAVWPVSQSVGIVIEIERGSGIAAIYRLDLVAGMRYADLALEVRAARKQKTAMFL